MDNSTVIIDNNIYGYDPNHRLAQVAAAIFALLMIVVLIINIRFRSWFFMVIPIASLMEAIGFVVRPYAAYSVGKYIISTLCILLAPTVYAMGDYAMISKMYVNIRLALDILTRRDLAERTS
jgi:hypothetical protein